jgi:hypothetical protein
LVVPVYRREQRMQRFLLLLLFVAMLVNTTSVRACSYERLSVEQLYAKASTVFVAHIVRTEEAAGLSPLSVKPEAIVEATFRLVENLKGQPPPDGKVKSLVWSNGNCSVLLAAGLDYLFISARRQLCLGRRGINANHA